MEAYSKIFAENLRGMRKHMRWTQEELAERLGYTEKAISKWEGGFTIPPAETIIRIADIFSVTLDELFGRCSQPTYFLGIDGGATKTTFALADARGNILDKIVLGSSNPSDIGFDAATRVLSEGINKITANIHNRKVSMFAGISGGGIKETRDKLRIFFENFGFMKVDNNSDGDNIIAAGLGDSDGITVIMGTGSSCFAKRDGVVTRVGGLGYLFDHAGGGYDLGNAAISYACKAEDGNGEPTILRDYMLELLGTPTVTENIARFYALGKTGIASYAQLIFRACAEGDKVAHRVLRENMEHVAGLISAAYHRRFEGESGVDVVLVGGLTKSADMFGPILDEKLCELGLDKHLSCRCFEGDVVIGALYKAGMPTSK